MLPDYFLSLHLFSLLTLTTTTTNYDFLLFFFRFFLFVMQILIQGLFFALLNTDNETKYYGLCVSNRCCFFLLYQLYTLLSDL